MIHWHHRGDTKRLLNDRATIMVPKVKPMITGRSQCNRGTCRYHVPYPLVYIRSIDRNQPQVFDIMIDSFCLSTVQ